MENKSNRKDYIGSGDISAVLGMSPYKTPLQLWSEKTGAVEPADLSDNEAVQMGIELEEFVARRFSKVTGKAVRQAPCHYHDKEHDWMRCQVDRLVTGTDELCECKTASLRKEKDWEGDEIPASYILQVQWQLMITGRSVGWIAVLIGGQKFLYKRIDADKELHQMMRERAIAFWSLVQSNTPPSAMIGDDDVLLALHPKSNEQIQALQEFETAVARRQELSQQIADLEEEKEEIEVKIKEAIADNLGFKTDKYIVLWTPTKTKRLDSEAIKAAGIYDQYCKTTETRRLTIKLNKAEAKGGR